MKIKRLLLVKTVVIHLQIRVVLILKKELGIFPINLTFDEPTFRAIITLDNKYHLDLTKFNLIN